MALAGIMTAAGPTSEARARALFSLCSLYKFTVSEELGSLEGLKRSELSDGHISCYF